MVLEGIDFEVSPARSGAARGRAERRGQEHRRRFSPPRLYDTDEGEVLVDGRSVRTLDPGLPPGTGERGRCRTRCCCTGTVAENIGYGVGDAHDRDIEAAARMANAHDFIMAMPDGYSTQLGERAATLSGGQRQRLAIARAFIRRAPILILDEPTTGLDRESADVVVSALRTLMHGTTTIVISHDAALVRCADRVMRISASIIEDHGRATPWGAAPPALPHGPAFAAPRVVAAPTTAPAVRADAVKRGPLALVARLPGVDRALDVDLVADRIESRLLRKGMRVDEITTAKHWTPADGTFGLRYLVRATEDGGHTGELEVSGRVHRDAAAAPRGLPPSTSGPSRAAPWLRSTAVVAQAQLALTGFPVDADLPTLPRAMDPDVLRGVASNAHGGSRPGGRNPPSALPAPSSGLLPAVSLHGTTVLSGAFAASRFTNRRAAPGTPLGS